MSVEGQEKHRVSSLMKGNLSYSNCSTPDEQITTNQTQLSVGGFLWRVDVSFLTVTEYGPAGIFYCTAFCTWHQAIIYTNFPIPIAVMIMSHNFSAMCALPLSVSVQGSGSFSDQYFF